MLQANTKDGDPLWIEEYEKDSWMTEWANGVHWAVASWLECCVEHGVDPSVAVDGKTALEWTVENTGVDSEDIIQVATVLLERGGAARLTEKKWVDLMEAAGGRKERDLARTLVKLLVAHGADGKGVGAYERKRAISRAIVNADEYNEVGEVEACRNCAEMAQWLCEGGGLRDLDGGDNRRMAKLCTMAARVRSGMLRHTMMKMLIDARADVTESDRSRRGPLFEAAVRNDGPTVRLILENGGDINELLVSRGHMKTGLMWDPALGAHMGRGAHDPLSALGCAATLEEGKLELLKKGAVRIEGYQPSASDKAQLAPDILLERLIWGWPVQTDGLQVEKRTGKRPHFSDD